MQRPKSTMNMQLIIENAISNTKHDARSSTDIFIELTSKSNISNVNTFNGSQNKSELFKVISYTDQSSDFKLKINQTMLQIKQFLKQVQYLNHISTINENDIYFVIEHLKQLKM
ncbi:Hypothetical_protein [Hexamita inflata]|uniref:Hypothetical_protein n=1 Tax=Hexamita inflata TaxID=28002 RepID=A0AA86QDM1_9EUKA|nr:Hypothetical protein HINF_LOCUS40613 [Hexamita inflata]